MGVDRRLNGWLVVGGIILLLVVIWYVQRGGPTSPEAQKAKALAMLVCGQGCYVRSVKQTSAHHYDIALWRLGTEPICYDADMVHRKLRLIDNRACR